MMQFESPGLNQSKPMAAAAGDMAITISNRLIDKSPKAEALNYFS
jgi:hypothetical protein